MMNDTAPDFLAMVRSELAGVTPPDWQVRDDRRSRGEVHVLLSKGRREIDLAYGPFGLPWCFVKEHNGNVTQIQVSVENVAGSRLALTPQGGRFEPADIVEHERSLVTWLRSTKDQIHDAMMK